MSIVFNPLFTSSLIIVPSRIFRICEFFIQHNNVFGSDNFVHLNARFDNARTSECYECLNSLACLEWNSLFAQVFDLFTNRCYKPLW